MIAGRTRAARVDGRVRYDGMGGTIAGGRAGGRRPGQRPGGVRLRADAAAAAHTCKHTRPGIWAGAHGRGSLACGLARQTPTRGRGARVQSARVISAGLLLLHRHPQASGHGPSRAHSCVSVVLAAEQADVPDLAAATATNPNPPATRGPMMVLEGDRVWL